MLPTALRTSLALAVVAAVPTALPALASAQPVTGPNAPSTTMPPKDVASTDGAGDHAPITIDINPLSFFIGRFGPNLQYLPARHHALVLNPFFVTANAEVESSTTMNGTTTSQKDKETFSGFGGEVGYRFYTGDRGANGFFVGPSLLFGTYGAKVEGGDTVAFNSIGYAVDIGGQAVLGNGFTIGGGFGMQYTKVNKDFFDLPVGAAVIAGGGWRPRFLLSLGYSFG